MKKIHGEIHHLAYLYLCLLVIKELLVVRHKQLYFGIYAFIAGDEGILFAVGSRSKDSWNLFQ